MDNDVNDQILLAEIESTEQLLRDALEHVEDAYAFLQIMEKRRENARGVHEEARRTAMMLEDKLNALDVERMRIRES